MAIRKNKRFIDPRYFMDEKTEKKIISEREGVGGTPFPPIYEEGPPEDPLDPVIADINQEHYGFLNTPKKKGTFVARVLTEYWDDLLPADRIGLYKLAVQLYASGLEDEAEIEIEPAPEEIEVEPAPEEEVVELTEKKKWEQPVAKSIEKKGHEGIFKKWCKDNGHGGVNQTCINAAYKTGKPWKARAALAVTFSKGKGGQKSLKYPQGSDSKKK